MKTLLNACAFLTIGAMLCGCNSKDKEIERLKAEIQSNSSSKDREIERLKAEIQASKQKEVTSARAQLELARAKGSLEETFLALKTLQALGSAGEEANEEIENTKRAIELLNSLRIAKGEHRHEDVVHVASELLELFPDNAEARKDMKESGLIFRYLESALIHEQKCLGADEKGGLSLVKAEEIRKPSTDKKGGLSIDKEAESRRPNLDLSVIAFNLQKAREQVDEAIKLDPQYDEALSVKRSVRQMQNTVGILVAQGIFRVVDDLRPLLAKTYNSFHSGMADAAASRYDSPKDYWRRTESARLEMQSGFSQLTTNLDSWAAFLSQLDAPDVSSVTVTAIQAVTLVNRLQKAVFSPRGNLNDYKSDYLVLDADYSKLVENLKTSFPNIEAIISDFRGFAQTVVGYKLFKNPDETRKILHKHEKLITQST